MEDKLASLEDQLENKVAALEAKKAQIEHLLKREGTRVRRVHGQFFDNNIFWFFLFYSKYFARFTHVKLKYKIITF